MPQVGHINYPAANIKLPIQFNPKTGFFRCVYAGTQYVEDNIQGIREKVLAAIQAAYDLTWTPVIKAVVPTRSYDPERILAYLEKSRFYVAHHKDLGYKQVHWTAQPEARLQASRTFSWGNDEPFTLPTGSETYSSYTVYLPYTQETWEQLQEITQYISIGVKALKKAIASPEHISAALELCRSQFDHYATHKDNGQAKSEED